MKNCFLLVAGIVLLSVMACQSDEPVNGGNKEEVTASFSVQVPDDGSAVTRAAGDGAAVNRCIMEIYLGDQLYTQEVAAISNLAAKFDVRLVTSQTYNFVFWADHVAATDGENIKTDLHYKTTDGLQAISMMGDYLGSSKDDTRDAFTANLEKKVINAFSESVTLTRPFGQLNIKTADLSSIGDNSLRPTKASLSFKNIYTGFNAATGELTGDPTAIAYHEAADVVDDQGNLTIDYLLAPKGEEQQHLVNMTLAITHGEGTISKDLNNIPVKRNYKTNVTGNLLTDGATLNVSVVSTFTGSLDEKVKEVASAAEVAEALKTNSNVVLTQAPQAETTISLPKYNQENVAVSVTLPETDKQITFGYASDGTGNVPKELNITCPSAGKVVINAPQTTVTLNGKKYTNVEATTADNTLIVGEDVEVETLTVKKGNVEIYGTVGTISFEQGGGYVNVYSVSTAGQLKAAGKLVNQKKCRKIVLAADIDLQGNSSNPWEPMDAELKTVDTGETNLAEFDGGGHTLSNLYVDNATGKTNVKGYYYGGLFYVLNGTVKNLTIDGVTVKCFRGAALVGRLDAGLVENCHVKNAVIYSEQKIGGLAGYVNNSNSDLTIRGCSVSTATLGKLDNIEEAYQMGGFIGYLQSFNRNVLIENNSVSDITINNVYTSTAEDLIANMEQTYCHAFIGNVVNVSDVEDAFSKYSVTLRNNRVDKQLGNAPTCDRTNNYIGWWAGDYNTSRSYSTKVVVDGEVMDRWIEVKRVANQLRTGGTVTIYRNVDLTKNSESGKPIDITAETTLTLNKGAVLTVGKQQIDNKSKLTVKGEGAMTATDYLLMNEDGATMIIEGGTFTATKATDANGVAIYNLGNCTINSGTFDAPGFTLMNTGNADMTINDGIMRTGGIQAGYALLTAGSGAKLTVNGGKIEAMQSVSGAHVTITAGSIYCEGIFYVVYNEGGNTSISGGYFYSPTGENIYIAANKGGGVTATGGYFSDQSVPLESGYKFQDNVQTVDGREYKYEVVAE